MEIEDLKLAGDKKFTDFSNAVKAELKSKLNNHPNIQGYKSEFERINAMKDLFSQVIKK